MKNLIILSLAILLFTNLSVNAASDKVHVTSLTDFSTANPTQKIDVRVIEDSAIGDYKLKAGDIIHCNLLKVTNPKRGKRSASFAVTPISISSEDEITEIKENYYGKYAAKIVSKEEIKNVDKVKVGKKAALSVGNHFIKGVAPAITLAKGMIKNEEGNRIESGVKEVYKSSPLSYIEKGSELTLTPDKPFYLIFKPSKDDNAENITKEMLDDDD